MRLQIGPSYVLLGQVRLSLCSRSIIDCNYALGAYMTAIMLLEHIRWPCIICAFGACVVMVKLDTDTFSLSRTCETTDISIICALRASKIVIML